MTKLKFVRYVVILASNGQIMQIIFNFFPWLSDAYYTFVIHDDPWENSVGLLQTRNITEMNFTGIWNLSAFRKL